MFLRWWGGLRRRKGGRDRRVGVEESCIHNVYETGYLDVGSAGFSLSCVVDM
jgi:hypothetical protein